MHEKLTGFAVYAGYRSTLQEMRVTMKGHVSVKIVQMSRWTHEARFQQSGKAIRNGFGEPIRGQISEVIARLADRFERVVEYPVWRTKTGELAGWQPADKPITVPRALARSAKAYKKAEAQNGTQA